MSYRTMLPTLVLAAVLLAGCTDSITGPEQSAVSSRSSASVQASEASDRTASPTIYETARNADQFTILVAALEAAGLDETLDGNRQFTVFAPTDAAFEALPDGTLEALLEPENKEQLVDILLYHVTPGSRLSQSVVNARQLYMLNGHFASIQAGSPVRPVMIEDANIVAVDIEASNGVIHVIDSVLLPPQ